MRHRTLLLFVLLAVLTAPFLPAAEARSAPGPLQGEDLDLKGVVDRAVRWLRAQQDESGSYGGTVEATSWVLWSLAASPRHYVRSDGPFIERAFQFVERHQREDGTFGEGDESSLSATLVTLEALSHYADPSSKATLKRSLDAGQRLPVDLTSRYGTAGTLDEAVAAARARLARRGDADHWDGPHGPVLETAHAIVDLSALAARLDVASKSSPATAVKLPPFDEATRKDALTALERGARFLMTTSQDGRFGAPGRPDAGLTAMVLSGLQCSPKPRPAGVQEAIDKGLAWLVSLQKENGAIHDGKLPNYITSASILALARAEDDARYGAAIERAQRFLIDLQADEGEGYTDGDLYYGGIGYGNDERPDLSNLQMALDALSSRDVEGAEEALRRAVKFLERTQNRSESNDVRVVDAKGTTVRSGDDGGAAYYPGNSVAGYVELADGTRVPRSCGSMTYSLLKGYIFAGIAKDDPRMQAAWKWIGENYTLDVNPGFEHSDNPMAAYQGLFYYFTTMARALDLYGEERIVDASGTSHRWRQQLTGRMIAMQNKEDGSWINENSPRWWEGNPLLSTAYAMLAIDAALPPAE